MFLKSRNSHTGPLFKVSKILKSFGETALENCIFISKYLKGLLASVFNNWFIFFFEPHSHDTRWSNISYLKMPSYSTKTYGIYSMLVNSIYVWNHFAKLPSKCYISSVESKGIEKDINYFFPK